MMLSDLLTPQTVSHRLRAATKRDALAELVELLEAGHGLQSHGEILDRVLRREGVMTTGIGNGVAIPHGKAKSVDRMLAVVAISPQGVEYEAVDARPVHILILLVSPENVGTPHVKVLANISRLLKEESVRLGLREAQSQAGLLDAIQSAERRFLHV